MKSLITIFVILLVIGTVGGLAVFWVSRARDAAGLTQCHNNLKQIGLALHNYYDQNKHLPTATHANPDLPPEKRFSWLSAIYPSYMAAGPVLLFDKTKAWDAPVNCPPRGKVFDNGTLTFGEEYVWGDVVEILCPANPSRAEPSLPSLTHYAGIAGVGECAADLPLVDAKAGCFGHDRKITFKNFKHGSATTIMGTETLDAGSWTAGGRATVRGLATDKLPYFGDNGQFGSHHRGRTNVLLGDATVRFFTTSASPQVIEAMAALAGDADSARFDD
jgi:hypothetical protein